jgi:pimeloyl-ACP methyl ester carboxylesterase
MNALLVAVLSLPASAAPPAPKVEALFQKVAPATPANGRSPGQTRAVILIHGLALHPLNKERILKAALRTWQQPGSLLVKELARDADVYALAYSQTARVEVLHEATGLAKHVSNLRKLGYRKIVLVGHSAGGLIARQLVEDYPKAGVTKVIQVSAPNTGSALAALRTARGVQLAFLTSMSRSARKAILLKRQDRRIPATVQFVCIIAYTALGGDGIVSRASQWSEDLQKQGIPAYLLRSPHWSSVKTVSAAELIARLVREAQPRWKPEQVAQARKKWLGN